MSTQGEADSYNGMFRFFSKFGPAELITVISFLVLIVASYVTMSNRVNDLVDDVAQHQTQITTIQGAIANINTSTSNQTIINSNQEKFNNRIEQTLQRNTEAMERLNSTMARIDAKLESKQ